MSVDEADRYRAWWLWGPLRDLNMSGTPPEPTSFNGPDDRDWPSVRTPEEEELREREFHELEALARDFVKTYGAAAMLRCVSEALK